MSGQLARESVVKCETNTQPPSWRMDSLVKNSVTATVLKYEILIFPSGPLGVVS